MADRTFTDGDANNPVLSTWLTDVNNTVYRLLGNSSGPGGTGGAPSTQADIIANMGLLTAGAAASTYLTQANASSTYLTQANAAATYETQAAAAAALAALWTGLKNRFINNLGAIDQYHSNAAIALSGTAAFIADRWRGAVTVGAVNSQAIATAGSEGLLFTTTTATPASFEFSQRIEAANIADTASQMVTVSFKLVDSTGVAAPVVAVSNPTAVDNYTSQSAFAAQTTAYDATSGNWKATFAMPANTINGAEIQISVANFGTASGATAKFENLQIELGSTITTFDRRPIGTESALCQRYYQYVSGWMGGYVASGGQTNGYYSKFSVSMRVSPTFTVSNTTNTNTTGATISIIDSQTWQHRSSGANAGGFISAASGFASAEL